MSTLLFLIAAFMLLELCVRHRTRWTRGRLALAAGLCVAALAAAAATLGSAFLVGKMLGRLAMPAGLLWMGLAGHVGWRWHRREERRELAIASVIFVMFTVVGSPFVGRALLYQLEEPYRGLEPLKGPTLDAVFVMGGGTGIDPRGRPILTGSGDRVLEAARMAKSGRTRLLVTSGSTIEGLGARRNLAAEAAQILGDVGVESSNVIQLSAPKNSSEEIAAYQELAAQRGWTEMGLVTSAWHLRRATRLAKRAGLDVEPIPSDFRGELRWNGVLSVIPDDRGFGDVTTACWEYLGAAVGR